MTALFSAVGMLVDLAIVILAFTLIIVIHEFGHFVAARWAGIRVLAFAVGFGPALFSYRKGLGLRRGSSAPEYNALARHIDTRIDRGWLHLQGRINHPVSPTEYRLNALPFGGYVKMLGQDDADPAATSTEVDGYQRCKPWKRMVVISAGVVFNIVSAGALFVIVFMAGLKTEPPIVGFVDPTSPAGTAVAVEAADLNITTPGLHPGDRVLSVDGDKAQSFKDVMLASAMAHRGDAIGLTIEREGVPRPLTFKIVPREDPVSKLLQFGVGPAVSSRVFTSDHAAELTQIRAALQRAGLKGVEPGMRLARIDGVPLPASDRIGGGGGGTAAIAAAARASDGKPLSLEFVTDPPEDDPAAPVAAPVTVTIPTTPRLEQLALKIDDDTQALMLHVGGLTTAMQVDSVAEGGKDTGLQPGDVFAQIGAVEWPSLPAAMAEIRRHKDSAVHVVVARRAADDAPWSLVDLKLLPVNAAGQIGFLYAQPDRAPLFLGTWSELTPAKPAGGTNGADAPRADTLARLKLAPGTMLTEVNGTPVKNLADLRVALAHAAGPPSAPHAPDEFPTSTAVTLTVADPFADASGSLSTTSRAVAWTLDDSPKSPDHVALGSITWTADSASGLFEPEQFELQAAGPLEAVGMGFRETKRVMLSTYVTFLRLFQGTVKVEHLKGPVGIAHMGTLLVDRGWVWLLFFAALVSVNLAVVNFLPVPITDGGHFLFLLYEQLTGRPVSIGVQNAAALVGLALVVGMFLIVTFNDISSLVAGR